MHEYNACPGILSLPTSFASNTPQKLAPARTRQVDDAHVRDIEHSGIAAHRVVFFELRAEAQGQVPAAEIDDLGAL